MYKKEKESRNDDVEDLSIEKCCKHARAKETCVATVETGEKKYDSPNREEKREWCDKDMEEFKGWCLKMAHQEREPERHEEYDDIAAQEDGVFPLRNEVHIW